MKKRTSRQIAWDHYGLQADKLGIPFAIDGRTALGELVVCLWTHNIEPKRYGTFSYKRPIGYKKGTHYRRLENELCRAKQTGEDMRIILISTDDPAALESGTPATKLKKSYEAQPHLIGVVTHYDENEYQIIIRRR
ncbi:hypothetical protein KVP09_02215 [Alcaligenaceae bacterium CGII-47]|nr:hypothetical protein [Alcaligenaceae bacterium CGII-47]